MSSHSIESFQIQAIHEIGHALGFYHEHARTDRDQFVEILWSNVKPGMEIQFEQRVNTNIISLNCITILFSNRKLVTKALSMTTVL
jgi:hypothetical protein